MRGLAALAVVHSHLVFMFVPHLHAANTAAYASDSSFLRLLALTPLNLIYNGSAAVIFFFVHSGFVLSLRHFQSGMSTDVIRRAALRRYFRLTGPVLFSTLVGYFLHVNGLFHHFAFAKLYDPWIAGLYRFKPDFWRAVYEGVYGAYASFSASSTYNTVLWTISTELKGSFLVFVLLAALKGIGFRCLWELLAVWLTAKTYFACFFLGMLTARLFVLQTQKVESIGAVGPFITRTGLRIRPGSPMRAVVHAALTLFALFLLTLTHEAQWGGDIVLHVGAEYRDLLNSVGATILICCILESPRARNALAWGPLQALGRWSYSVYLLHLLVLCSFTSWLSVVMVKNLGYSVISAGWVSWLATYALLLGLSAAMYRIVDCPSIAASRRIELFLFPDARR